MPEKKKEKGNKEERREGGRQNSKQKQSHTHTDIRQETKHGYSPDLTASAMFTQVSRVFPGAPLIRAPYTLHPRRKWTMYG